MSLNMNKAAPSKQRVLIPDGQQRARLVETIDLGLQAQRPYKGEPKAPAYELYLTYEFPDHRIEVDGVSRPKWKSRRIKLSSHEKSHCYNMYKQHDPQNTHKGDWAKLLNSPIGVLIVHDAGTGDNVGKTFDNIGSLIPLMHGVEVPPLENDTKLFDLTAPDMEVFNKLPAWLQDTIKSNLQYDNSKLQHLLEGTPQQWTARAPGDASEGALPETDSPNSRAPEVPEDTVEDTGPSIDFDDDIGF